MLKPASPVKQIIASDLLSISSSCLSSGGLILIINSGDLILRISSNLNSTEVVPSMYGSIALLPTNPLKTNRILLMIAKNGSVSRTRKYMTPPMAQKKSKIAVTQRSVFMIVYSYRPYEVQEALQ